MGGFPEDDFWGVSAVPVTARCRTQSFPRAATWFGTRGSTLHPAQRLADHESVSVRIHADLMQRAGI
jgi:hypothetical protein